MIVRWCLTFASIFVMALATLNSSPAVEAAEAVPTAPIGAVPSAVVPTGLERMDLDLLHRQAALPLTMRLFEGRHLQRTPSFQSSGGGWSGLSTARKTWIIVGSVVGAAVVVAVISNNHSGGGGGY